MFALAGAGAAAVAAAGGSLAFWKAKREVNAMFEGDEKADQRRAEVEEAAVRKRLLVVARAQACSGHVPRDRLPCALRIRQ